MAVQYQDRAPFGWIIQVGDTIITRGKGLAYGPDLRSFWAEGYGMASRLLFIRLLQQYFVLKWNNVDGNQIICDNEDLLIRIESILLWT